jgi:S-adenosylmethionine:tRNA ribosyltransferase-isomerase
LTDSLEDFDYALPPELIAQHPAAERSASRLLRVTRDSIDDRAFTELPELLEPGDLLVFNDTRVIRARLLGRKASGGKVEVFVERILDEREALVQLRCSKSPAAGTRLLLEGELDAEVLDRSDDLYRLRFDGSAPLLELLERHGRVPLPPYINHAAVSEDAERYQTVYARQPGAVAAPTAGLHFDQPLLERLRQRGVGSAWLTLHVGAGTFQPVRVTNLDQHRMHAERYEIPATTRAALKETRARGGRIVAVGTTSVRALESAAQSGANEGETRLFIRPGFEFRAVDRMITNFHLPKSTLLMLVSAFAGRDRMLHAYRHAVEQRYRFFSYGDAMLVDRIAPVATDKLRAPT